MIWLISANGKIFHHAAAFKQNKHIDWRQNKTKYAVGDIVYIYCTEPIGKIMFKAVVDKVQIPFQKATDDKFFWTDIEEYEKSKVGDFVRLTLLDQVDTEKLSWRHNLKSRGLKRPPQGPIHLNPQLAEYIDSQFPYCYHDEMDIDRNTLSKEKEGGIVSVYVNKYERSHIARQRCITLKGTKCFVCELDFKERYGDIGNGFIHVHHLIPLHTINETYEVDAAKDLIPICPNCHAMLHRKFNDKYLSPEELKQTLNSRMTNK